jgi:hypothetical protein
MKMTKYAIASAILGTLSALCCAKAQDSTPTVTTAPSVATSTTPRDEDQDYPLYRPQELDLDVFASGALSEDTLEHLSNSSFRHHSVWGGGGGLTGFFCRYVGVGGEFDADARAHQFVDSASGNVYLRLPILETGLAPYIFGGGGYQFEEVRQSFGQAGAGLEFRFCRHAGIFVDGRWVFPNHTDDYALARAGLRISF